MSIRSRSALSAVADVLLILGAEAGVFIYVLRRSGEETGGIVAILYTVLFALIVVPLFELAFRRLVGTTPGRVLLGLRAFDLQVDKRDGSREVEHPSSNIG